MSNFTMRPVWLVYRGAMLGDENREEAADPITQASWAVIKALDFTHIRWKAVEEITQCGLDLRWYSFAVVWKLDWKKPELTKWTHIIKIQARNGLDYSCSGGMLKSGCNPGVPESQFLHQFYS